MRGGRRRGDGVRAGSSPAAGGREIDARSWPERRLRRAWRRGAGPGLRTAGLLYAMAAEGRNLLYEAGVLASRRPAVPVVSVGGLSAGGSGKTPAAAVLAGELEKEERRVGVVTHGYRDELEVHRRLAPDRVVAGGRERLRAVARAAGAGADLVVVDSGLQRRRMARAVEVVVVGPAEARSRGRLPAGPFREGWAALDRADAVVLTRRTGSPAFAGRFRRWLGGRFPDAVVAVLDLRPGRIAAANRAAREHGSPAPAVAVASVMHPEPFFQALSERGAAPEVRVRLPDHGRPEPELLETLVERAGDRGMVGTLKDVVELEEAVGEATPLWYLTDAPEWVSGRATLIGRIERILEETT